MNNHKIEILAPAGNMESLRAAVINGADAVYLGASGFSARAKAGNFNDDELRKAVEYCHLFGVKVYLAINTIIKPSEYSQAIETVLSAKNIGVDAFIVQDIAFLRKIHSTMSDIIVHLSTQAGIHNLEGALVAQALGATRVILSRETLLEDMVKIKENTTLEIEYFVHGALCVAFSGNCYLSSLAAGLSGNRGKCLQLCRKKYSALNKNGYLLSAKDIKLTNKLKDLIGAGVTSFKIEGRMRRAEYVGEAVKHYKKATQNAISGTVQTKISDIDIKKLFNRGDFCEAYLNSPTENLIYPNIQGHMGVCVGKVSSFNKNKAILDVNSPLNVGDGLKFLRNNVEVGSANVSIAGKSVTFEGNLKVGDEVRLTTDANLINKIAARKRTVAVNLTLSGAVGESIKATACTENVKIEIASSFVLEKAKNGELNFVRIKECFEKNGEKPFKLSDFTCNLDKTAFIPMSLLNNFRREVYDKLQAEILRHNASDMADFKFATGCFENGFNEYYSNCERTVNDDKYDFSPDEEKVIVQIQDFSQLDHFASGDYDAISLFPKKFDDKLIDKIELFIRTTRKRVYLSLPLMIRGRDREIIEKLVKSDAIDSYLVNNVGHLEQVKGKNFILSPMMNIVDPDFLSRKIMSIEYDDKNFGDNFAYVYGKFPLMTFAHCPKKTLNNGKCQNCNLEAITYTDDRKNEFPINFYKVGYCYSQLLNCVPINLLGEESRYGITRKFIDLVGASPEECVMVAKALNGEGSITQFTRGYRTKILQ